MCVAQNVARPFVALDFFWDLVTGQELLAARSARRGMVDEGYDNVGLYRHIWLLENERKHRFSIPEFPKNCSPLHARHDRNTHLKKDDTQRVHLQFVC